ncbi:MAG: alpha-amylase family protein [Phycisphaerae bacterium]
MTEFQFLDHPKPAWLDDGPLIVVGSWEGWHHLARNNFLRDDQAPTRYRTAHTREFAQKLADAGCTLYIGSFWKGLGLEEESEEMAMAGRMAAYCHEVGMKMGVYIGDTLYFESLREEVPDCEQWAMRDPDGDPITYGTQYWRYRACKNNSDYRTYLKNVLHKAIVEAKVDMIHFDNVFAEPFACYCRHCDEGFQKWIQGKYPDPEDRRRRFGIRRSVRFALPRFWKQGRMHHSVIVTKDPVFTEWLDYRCHAMAGAVKDLADYIRSLNPDVAVEINPIGILGHNNALFHAVDHDRLLKSTDLFWSEEPERPGMRDSKLITNIRSCKLSRATGNSIFLYSGVNPQSPYSTISKGDARIKLGQILAFAHNSAGCVSFFHEDEFDLDDATRRYIKFYRTHADIYCSPRSLAKIALWRSSRSLANDSRQPHLSAVLWEQMMLQRHILFDLVLDSHIGHLDSYAAVILPSAQTISDKHLRILSDYVDRGGALVIEDMSGLRNEENIVRSAFPADTFWSRLQPQPGTPSPVFAPYGRGKVVWTPPPVQHGGVKPSNDLFWYDYLFNAYTNNWEIPANEGELLTALDWAAGGRQLITTADEYTVFDLTSNSHGNLLLHAVNFNPDKSHTMQIILELPTNNPVQVVQVLSPDRAGPVEVQWRQDDKTLTVNWRDFVAYDVLRIFIP